MVGTFNIGFHNLQPAGQHFNSAVLYCEILSDGGVLPFHIRAFYIRNSGYMIHSNPLGILENMSTSQEKSATTNIPLLLNELDENNYILTFWNMRPRIIRYYNIWYYNIADFGEKTK